MERPTRRIEWNYGLFWVFANAVAWAVGIALPWLVGAPDGAWGFVAGVAGPLLIGGVQWWVLSRRFPHSPWWLIGYGTAWFVAIVVGAYFGFLVPDPLWVGATGGLLAGVMQWVVLRRYAWRAVAWLPTMIASTIVGCLAGVKVGWSAFRHTMSDTASYVIGGGVAGATLGLLSAIVLLYFVSQTDKAVTPAETELL